MWSELYTPDVLELLKTCHFKKSAVLVPVYEKDHELHIILTERSQTVEHHKGQICFPGGVQEPKDKNLWHTALRETEEELGIPERDIHYVTELPQQLTPSFYEMTPFVAFIHGEILLKPNPHEIKSVIEIPIHYIKNKENLYFERRVFFNKEVRIPYYLFNDHKIWGATGRILYDLIEIWHEK